MAEQTAQRERLTVRLEVADASRDVAQRLEQVVEDLLADAERLATPTGDAPLQGASEGPPPRELEHLDGIDEPPLGSSVYLLADDGSVLGYTGSEARLGRIPEGQWSLMSASRTARTSRLLGPLSMSVGERTMLAVAPVSTGPEAPADSRAVRWLALSVSVDAIVARAGIVQARERPVAFELTGRQAGTRRPATLFATRPEALDRPLAATVRVRDWTFDVKAAPRSGWETASTGSAARILAFMLAVLAGGLAHELLGARRRALRAVERSRARLRRAHRLLVEEGERREELEARMYRDAVSDALTGLPSRSVFLRTLRRAVLQAANEREPTRTTILCIGLDRFSEVKDTLGPAAADAFVKAVAERLFELLRPADVLARLSPDRFAVALAGGAGPEASLRVWPRIAERFAEPIVADGHAVVTSVSGGVTHVAKGTEDPEDVLQEAEIALTQAQRSGQGRILAFDDSIRDRAAISLKLAGDLRHALERGEIRLAYQPIVRLPDRNIAGMEVLARWHHEAEGIVSPGLFIPIAEEDGFIVQMNAWILKEAANQLEQWRRRGLVADDFYLSVNTSPLEMDDDGYVESVLAIMDESGAPPRSVALEVTERLMTRDVERAADTLNRLRESGFKLLLDDFGTGYSSLAYLYRFRFDGLKIDRAFVAELDRSAWHRAVVRTMLSLCDDLDMKAIAEGIETEAVTDALVELGCYLAQGYLFARPVYVEDAEALLQADRERLGREGSAEEPWPDDASDRPGRTTRVEWPA